jgi:Leucine-rich repeat (LRR) protein
LPELRLLDLSFNKLKEFDFDYFDQIGTLSYLTVNVSHNVIHELSDNSSMSLNTLEGKYKVHKIKKHCNITRTKIKIIQRADPCIDDFLSGRTDNNPSHIKVLDMSFNNISRIDYAYFRSAEKGLIDLSLAHNYLQVIFKTSSFTRLTD